MNTETPLHERIAAAKLTVSEAQVAAFIAANPALIAVSSTAELGDFTETSDATVVRTAKKLGYDNFRHLRRSALEISGRYRDPSKVLDDQLGQISTSSSGPAMVLRDTGELLTRLGAGLDTEVWDHAVAALSGATRVLSYGSGPSGCVAEYLSICLKRIGLRSSSITVTGFRLADELLDLSNDDVVVLFATLRRFREIDVILEHAKKVGATSIVISETLGEALRDSADIVLATPQSTTGTSDGVIMGMVLAHALELAVANNDQSNAIHSMERLNELRAEIVGGALEVDGRPAAGQGQSGRANPDH